jgi:NADPH-dependent dioxygenase
MIPVLIVGGGAAGTMLHLELARRGINARSIDRLPGPASTSRAITIHARTAEIMERIDARLIARYMARALPSKGYILHFVDDTGRRSDVRPGLDFTTLDCRYPRLYIHPQHETEQVLRDFMREQFGQSTEWNRELIEVEHAADSVVATIRRADGATEQLQSRFLVACDGSNSRVRRCLRLLQDESDYRGSVMQNLDVFLENFPDTTDYVHYCAGRDHFLMIVQLPGGYYRLLLSDRGEASAPDQTPGQAFMRIVNQHFDGVTLGSTVWHSRWESHVRLAHAYRSGNVFLAGDSAHVHSTSGGQGMNCCLQDAYNLGWKLAMVLSGQAGTRLLDSYEAERKPIAEQVIWAASALHEIFMGHGKSIAERSARLSDPEFLDAVVGRCSGISYSYRTGAGQACDPAGSRGALAVGDRAPDVDLGDGRTLYALTRHTGFTLFGIPREQDAAAPLAATIGQLQRRFAAILRAQLLPAGAELARRYGVGAQPLLVLIRPDGYIACLCGADEAQQVARYLEELTLV